MIKPMSGNVSRGTIVCTSKPQARLPAPELKRSLCLADAAAKLASDDNEDEKTDRQLSRVWCHGHLGIKMTQDDGKTRHCWLLFSMYAHKETTSRRQTRRLSKSLILRHRRPITSVFDQRPHPNGSIDYYHKGTPGRIPSKNSITIASPI